MISVSSYTNWLNAQLSCQRNLNPLSGKMLKEAAYSTIILMILCGIGLSQVDQLNHCRHLDKAQNQNPVREGCCAHTENDSSSQQRDNDTGGKHICLNYGQVILAEITIVTHIINIIYPFYLLPINQPPLSESFDIEHPPKS